MRSAIAAWLVLSLPLRALADGPVVEVHFRAPAGCPDEAALHAALVWMLGHPLDVGATEAFYADAEVRAEPNGFSVVIRTSTRGEQGERALHASTCAELAEATTVIIAIAIDPALVIPSTTPPALVAPPEGREPLPDEIPTPEEPDVTVTEVIAPQARPMWAVSLGAVLDTHLIAVPTLGLETELAVTFGRLRASTRLAFHPARRLELDDRPAGGDVLVFTAGVRGCYVFAAGRFELAPCVGVASGLSHAEGYGVTDPTSATAPWLAIDAGARVAVRLHTRLALGLTIDGVLPLLRPTYFLESIGDVYQPRVFTARFALALELRFP
jgi:hypothetical protein